MADFAPFKYPFVANAESFVGMTNREIVEREQAKEAATSPSEETAEKDEGYPLSIPTDAGGGTNPGDRGAY